MASCRAEPSQAGLDTRPHAETWILQLFFHIWKKCWEILQIFLQHILLGMREGLYFLYGVWIYFIWLKNQTSLFLIFSSSLLTIFIWLQWACLSQTYLYIPVRFLCVDVSSGPRSPACPAPLRACWGSPPTHTLWPRPAKLAPQYEQLCFACVMSLNRDAWGNSKTESLPLALLCCFLPQNSFFFSLSLLSPQSLATHPPLLPWLYCLDVLMFSYLITFNSFLHSIDFAITKSICCMWSKGGWEGCFSNGFFPP